MKKNDAEIILRHINGFLTSYAPNFLSSSHHTLKSYGDALRLYIIFLEKDGVGFNSLSWKHFDSDMIKKWMIWLRDERGCSADTCNIRLSSIRTFLKYIQGKDISNAHLYEASKGINRLPVTKKKVTGLSKEVVSAILNAPDTNDEKGLRDFSFFMLLYSTACRLDEILSLRLKDIHLDCRKPFINITGKGQKQRVAYVLPRVVYNLKAYILRFHGNKPELDSFLFFSPMGEGKERKLTEPAMDKRLKLYAKKAHEECSDVPLDVHCHQFRHAKATHWIEDGIDVVKVSFLLGHENLETTMKYLDVSIGSKTEALATIETETDRNESKKWKGKSLTAALKCITH